VAVACLALLALGSSARSEEMGLQSFTGGSALSPSEATLGWKFTLLQPLTLTHLGLWDSYQDGLLEDHQIGIWTAAGDLVPGAEATATLGGGGDDWRWVALPSSVYLAPGEYVIGAWCAYKNADETVVMADSITTAPWVEFQEYRYTQDSFAYPSQTYPGAGYSAFGPNLKGDPVPEPALAQLPFLLGLGGIVWWRRRRR